MALEDKIKKSFENCHAAVMRPYSGIMNPKLRQGLMTALLLFARYFLGLAVACILSWTVLIVGMVLGDCSICFWLVVFFVGFVGVFFGPFTVPVDSRRFAAMIFLGLGLDFYRSVMLRIKSMDIDSPPPGWPEYPHFWPLLWGGLTAIAAHWIFWGIRQKKWLSTNRQQL